MIPYYLRYKGNYKPEYLLKSYVVVRGGACPLRVRMNGHVANQYANSIYPWDLQEDLSNNRVRSLCKKNRWEF